MDNYCIVCGEICNIEGYFYPAEKRNYNFQKDKIFGYYVRYCSCEKHLGIDKRKYLKNRVVS